MFPSFNPYGQEASNPVRWMEGGSTPIGVSSPYDHANIFTNQLLPLKSGLKSIADSFSQMGRNWANQLIASDPKATAFVGGTLNKEDQVPEAFRGLVSNFTKSNPNIEAKNWLLGIADYFKHSKDTSGMDVSSLTGLDQTANIELNKD